MKQIKHGKEIESDVEQRWRGVTLERGVREGHLKKARPPVQSHSICPVSQKEPEVSYSLAVDEDINEITETAYFCL